MFPTPVKTWQVSSNNFMAGGSSYQQAHRVAMLTLKNAIKFIPISPWTPVRSCGYVSSTWTVADSDLWTTEDNLGWGNIGSNHAWILLQQAGMSGFQMVIDLVPSASYGENIQWVLSPSGVFTGGTTTNRPTAVDEEVINGGDFVWGGDYPEIITGYVHVGQSTDGTATWWMVNRNGNLSGFGGIQLAQNPISAWTNPWVAWWKGSATSNYDPSVSAITTATFFTSDRGGLYGTTEAYNGGEFPTSFTLYDEVLANEFALQQYHIGSMGLVSETVGYRGRKGDVTDIWWFASGNNQKTVPADDSHQFLIIGDIMVPWNGTVPLFTG